MASPHFVHNDRPWHSRLTRALNLLNILSLDDLVYSREFDPENARWWRGMVTIPAQGGRPVRHRGGPTSCLFCSPSVTSTTARLIALLSETCCSTGVSQHMPRRMTSRVRRRTLEFSSKLTTPTHCALFAPMCGLWAVSVREWMQWRALEDSPQVARAEVLADFGVLSDVAWT